MIRLIVIALLALLLLVFLRGLVGLALLALAACLAVAVVRALMLRATPAKTAQPPKADPERAKAYGEKLSAMVKIETVSSRFDPDREKFRVFRQSLRELFPRVFEACQEHHPGDGLVLVLKSENPKSEPILLMSHHDVVEAKSEGWDHGPFSGDIDGEGRVWGRGTVDTKGSLMCELQALE